MIAYREAVRKLEIHFEGLELHHFRRDHDRIPLKKLTVTANKSCLTSSWSNSRIIESRLHRSMPPLAPSPQLAPSPPLVSSPHSAPLPQLAPSSPLAPSPLRIQRCYASPLHDGSLRVVCRSGAPSRSGSK